jgi:hypothetical protein
MKLITTLAIGLLSLSSFASDYTYNCEQRTDRSPVDARVGKISVIVKQISQVQSYGDFRGQYVDGVDKVSVEIRATKGSQTKVIRKATVLATSEDVMFNINDKGIDFHLYMDELEESGIVFNHMNRKLDVSLICE